MKRTSTSVAGDIRTRTVLFLSGLVLGLGLAISGPAMSEGESTAGAVVSSVLYAISMLAADTETNAAKIMELEDRIITLEARISGK